MAENKFIKHLKGEQTAGSLVEIKNQNTPASFGNMPQGTSDSNVKYSDVRGDVTVVANGTTAWKLNDSALTLAPIVNGDGTDYTGKYEVSGAGLWVNSTYTFPSTGDPNHPVAMIFNPNSKWVLKLCGDNLIVNDGNTLELTVVITIGSSNIISKQFTIREQANQFCKELVIDFDESSSALIKASGLSTMQLQVLCGTADASARIYNGMTTLTVLQRKVDAAVVSGTFANVEEVLRDGILPSDYFNNAAYIAQIEDGDSAYAVFTRDGDTVALSGWAQPIPDQTNNAGKFLTTDGSLMSWEELTISNVSGLQDELDGLQDQIDDLSGRGRYLSIWNCTTGLAETNPPTSPYTYQSGDYFIVGTVGATNYRPDGSSYTTGVASTTVETAEVKVDDVYIYDGTNWKLLASSQRTYTFAGIAGSPYDNTNLGNALDTKANNTNRVNGAPLSNSASVFYGTSDTAAATVQKEVSIPSITTLDTGTIIIVQPTVTSTVANSTLKLNDFTAYPMRYNNAAITTSTDSTVWSANYPSIWVFDGTYWVFAGHGLDSNTTYTLNYSVDAGQYTAGSGSYAITRYSIVAQKADGTWEKITATNASYSTGTSKSVNTSGFILNQLRYYGTTTGVASGVKVATNVMYEKAASVDMRYSTNCSGTTTWALGDYIYLVGTIGVDGLFYLDTTTWWSNALPTTNDGKLYIRLGLSLTAAGYTISFFDDRPIFYHDGTGIKEYKVADNKQDVISDLATIRSGASAGATAVQPSDLATVATTGDYDDLLNKPTIPTVNDATLTIQKNGTSVATFTANASSNVTANISVPTTTNDLTNNSGFITSSDIPVTDVTVGGTSVVSSGVAVVPAIPTVNDATITIKQGGVTKGSFTLNQASGDTIDLDAGGSGGYHPDLFDVKWSDHQINDIQWLRGDTFSWQDGSVYEAAYQHLVDDISGKSLQTETVAGTTISFYLADDGHKICPDTQESNVSAIFTATGVAWYYILDTVNQRFKLPRTQYGFTGLRDTVEKYVEAGLPNITGTGDCGIRFDQGNPTFNGCFTNVRNGGIGSDEPNTTGKLYDFDASASNSIYGNSNSVQPPATQMYLYFYVGSFTQTAIENTAGLNASLFNGKADLDFGNTTMIDYVVEKQDPTALNNYTWYRKYKSGWVEQGGIKNQASSSAQALTLPVEMSGSTYSVLTSVMDDNLSGYVFCVKVTSKTTTGFNTTVWGSYQQGIATSGYDFVWQVSGMAA